MAIKLAGKLSPYMNRQAQADMIALMPKHPTPVKDLLFPASAQTQKNSPFVDVESIKQFTGAIPVSVRGSRSYPVDADGKARNLIEISPVSPSLTVLASEINDLIALGDTAGVQALLLEYETRLRDIVSDTIELMSRQSLSGKISYPLYNGTDATSTYDIELGKIKDNGSVKLTGFDNAKVLNWLSELRQAQQNTGAGTQIVFLMGIKAFAKVTGIIQSSGSNPPIVWTDTGARLFGSFDLRPMPYSYTLPTKIRQENVIADNAVQTLDLSYTGRLFYGAVDDLDAKLAALPFFVKPVDSDDPSGIKLIAQSKPLTAAAVGYMTKTTVVDA
jgi:hypothetical protein